ncbi:hypothetical protein CN931_28615 [Bacillus sp. AFS054943]|uniref:Y-family DNA polymerase n=1 Tax=unclassified Bacillus (in: firmicutes) TaxID=185979 RepID=UPI000BF2715F|nr:MULTISPECIES: hypothetical protein [unclassified Bacillus (in: firmicutes)]PFA55487.1 hypothetical protein CN402_26280 [Bacillus sp. AFS015896]PGL74791.1 hypothetical protein CN931_28615 [Bacillus sp. AFS054943]
MYDYFLLPNRIILCVDLRSFYASVSCIKKGLDPRYTKLAVVGDVNQSGSIVLAATPPLKALGIRKMARLYEIPKRPDIFGPCHKKKCVGCKMLITGPQKLSMWKQLYSEQQSYLDEYEKVMVENNIDDWKEYREYQAEISLLKTYDDTIQKLEKFIKERLSEDEQKQYFHN